MTALGTTGVCASVGGVPVTSSPRTSAFVSAVETATVKPLAQVPGLRASIVTLGPPGEARSTDAAAAVLSATRTAHTVVAPNRNACSSARVRVSSPDAPSTHRSYAPNFVRASE